MSTAAHVPLGAALLLVPTGASIPTAVAAPTDAAAPIAPRVERISTAADGTQADGGSSAASLTPNGRFVAFRSSATTLVPEGVTHSGTCSRVRDLRTGADRTIADTAAAGTGAVSDRAVTFTSSAPDLVPADTYAVADIFLSHTH
ncbi:hypothetical protein [Streptomyces sp. NPDC005485]|uniref:hypothetical protein n=1 Tax=Streptomyces sp. NPDC005485 TaxID=3155591 RepID=UPI0033BC64C5